MEFLPVRDADAASGVASDAGRLAAPRRRRRVGSKAKARAATIAFGPPTLEICPAAFRIRLIDVATVDGPAGACVEEVLDGPTEAADGCGGASVGERDVQNIGA